MAAIADALVGWWLAVLAVLSVIATVAWFRFNTRQATRRLFQSNFASYWSARRAGSSHEHALNAVVTSRYQFESAKREEMLRAFGEAAAWLPPASTRSEQESRELKALVWMIFCKESGEPPTADGQKKLRLAMEESFTVVEARARLDAIGQRVEK